MTDEEAKKFIADLELLADRYGLQVGGGGNVHTGTFRVGFRHKPETSKPKPPDESGGCFVDEIENPPVLSYRGNFS